MVKHTIQIFARIKPIKQAKTGLYVVDDDDEGCPRLQLVVPRELAAGFINNKKENYFFRFNRIFEQKVLQDEVFSCVAQPVIDNALQGFNGTIFAYGQTGSGKTFTITGGPERYSDRGIIPRSLSYIFDTIEKHPDKVFTVNISYLEIYNENGYDLLDPKHEASKLEDLPKVSLMEDADQNIHLKNLTVHQASCEEDALNLLFMGDTNRMIAETPMNQASSRSHCIFTVHLTSKDQGSATIRKAKLHLVDLAGSERVSKTGVNGIILTEAKYINLSLHYLEQVILALSEKNRQHVPYRNSLMTSVLRDSLGGNCMTTMIATCSMEKSNIDESISTCRFAQRVAMVKNEVTLNEELDPRLLLAKLKRENAELREQLALAAGEQLSGELSHENIESCEHSVRIYLQDPDPENTLEVGHDLRKIHRCFRILKRLVHEKPLKSAPQQMEGLSRESSSIDVGPYKDAETRKLKELLEQRDNEINILVNMLKHERKKASDFEKSAHRTSAHSAPNVKGEYQNGHHRQDQTSRIIHENGKQGLASPTMSQGNWNHQETFDVVRCSSTTIDEGDTIKAQILGDMSLGRQEAFDIFIQDYRDRDKIETNKQFLKQKYTEAKALGERLNKSKQKMNFLKNSLAQNRIQSGLSGQDEPDVESHKEAEIKNQMEQEKFIYKNTFVSLRSLKTEIEHMQHLLEKLKVKLMKDFEIWWAEQMANSRSQAVSSDFPPWGPSQKFAPSAWKTPPVTPVTHTLSGGHLSHRTLSHDNLSSVKSDADITDSGYRQAKQAKPALGGLTLTGDSKVDADIEAFVRARQNILRKVNSNQR